MPSLINPRRKSQHPKSRITIKNGSRKSSNSKSVEIKNTNYYIKKLGGSKKSHKITKKYTSKGRKSSRK
jgi:hypothetical protein